jgi:hypothetical protein
MVRLSFQPSSRSRFKKAAVHGAQLDCVLDPKMPTVGSFPACCACAASGHANAMRPSATMNFRLAMSIAIGPSIGGHARWIVVNDSTPQHCDL